MAGPRDVGAQRTGAAGGVICEGAACVALRLCRMVCGGSNQCGAFLCARCTLSRRGACVYGDAALVTAGAEPIGGNSQMSACGAVATCKDKNGKGRVSQEHTTICT
jgi:hypothetical protein